ncbi:uncharacterized protein LOC111600668 [Drosophila hydei]|uniref:Uncharacterized protein LOC111600668 n=1 Tax=Drosophila hydei TaxID=7224 RepID=A0A6J1LZ33_DROHY|nr:uncharacterized protein LOC111600668 [Drosophila hydei]
MDKDLDFLIKALSVPKSPLWAEYSEDQLTEMRESFIMLKHVLFQNTCMLHESTSHLMRFTAGGNSATDHVPTVSQCESQFRGNFQSSLTSLPSSSLSEDDDATNYNQQDAASQGDDETSTTENFLAIVPYEKDEPSTELVRYEPWLEGGIDDSFDTDTLRASLSLDTVSGSGARTLSTSSGGGISISIPMKMEYVWHNKNYKADSTDSDLTIIADGFNYVLSR